MVDAERQADELRFIRLTMGWPHWPFLPLKLLGGGRFGVLFDSSDGQFWFREGNVFKLMEGEQRLEEWTSVDIEALVRDGWVVD